MAEIPRSSSTEPRNAGAEFRIALALTMIWLVAVAIYILGVPGALETSAASFLNLLLTFIGMFFPVILIWTVAYVTGSVREIRAESGVLRSSLEQIRDVVANAPAPDTSRADKLQAQLDEIAALTHTTEARLLELANRAEPAPAPPVQARTDAPALGDAEQTRDYTQTLLPLQAPEGPQRMPITIAEFIKALNFPDNPQDREGFRVLRRAFEERELGKLLQAAQDVLTLLSQDGIYMDDLKPDKPMPAAWRTFATGQRGPGVSALAGVQDRSAITLAKTRMKNDPVFRDAAHHFLRKYDQILQAFCATAEDHELIEMGETRTARAFMLLGKVAGSFD